MIPAFVYALFKLVGWDLLKAVGARASKQIHNRGHVVVSSAFQRDLLQINQLNMEIFGEDNGIVIEDICGEKTNGYIALNCRTHKMVGFMIIAQHDNSVEVRKLGVVKCAETDEICEQLLDIVNEHCRVGAFVTKSWYNCEQLLEFYTNRGFVNRGETFTYYFMERS